MIAFVDGVVAEVSETSVVVEVGGVGLELLAPASTLAACRPGERVRLRTQLIVRDEQPTLYGFDHPDQLALFRRLLDVTGVGPKVAMGVLSTLPISLVVTAVTNQDAGLLTSAPGVGKRTAERIVLELRDRLPDALLAAAEAGGAARRPLGGAGADAVAALLALGYREAQVKGVVAELAAANPDDGAEALIRKSLARLR
ncbi:MAG: Holliday junction branch migration protein RuvA [Deinococcales bacterium]|nr:Holliday junction branch migration protein RuvA [Deinococcales bacterium]